MLQLYQYVIPSSVLCSVQTLADAAAGFCELAADEEAATAGAAPAAGTRAEGEATDAIWARGAAHDAC